MMLPNSTLVSALSEVGAVILPESEERSIQNPAVPLTSSRVLEYVGAGGGSSAGVAVTAENSVGVSAILAAVNILSRTIAALPVSVVHTIGREKIRLEDHPAAVLLDRDPNDDMTAQIFREVLLNNLILYGRAFAMIERDRFTGEPVELIPLPSASTKIERTNGFVRVVSRVSPGVEITVRDTDALYIPGFSMSGLDGHSAIDLAPDVVGISIASQNYAGGFYKNGQTLAGVLEFPSKVGDEEDVQRIRKSWQDLHSGERNAYKVAILEQGMKYQSIAVSPEQGQLLQTRKFQVDEIARITGVPPHLLFSMERATFSNIEEMGASFLRYWLTPWILRIEQEANRKLLAESEKRTHAVKLNVNALLRGDAKSRAEYYKLMAERMTINEQRALEDLPPVEGGDEIFVPLNMTPLDKAIAADPDPEPAPAPDPDPPVGAPSDDEDPAGAEDDQDGGDAAENIVEGAKLNGAQITAAKDLIAGVVEGTLPDAVALELLVAVGIDETKARTMVDAAKTFVPDTDADENQDAAPAPAGEANAFDATRTHWTVDSVRRLVASEIPSIRSRIKKHLAHHKGADVDAFRSDLARFYDKFEKRAADLLSGPLGDTNAKLVAARICRQSLEALTKATARSVPSIVDGWEKTKTGEICAEICDL